MVTLHKIMDTELRALKSMRTKGLRISLDEMLLEARNAIKGMDKGVFDQVVGPDVMSRALSVKYRWSA